MTVARTVGAVGGALVAGLGITALLIAGERKSGEPSELTRLERASSKKLGRHVPPAGSLPDPGEQALVQGGHLLLSAVAGLVYAATTEENAAIVPSGLVFGLVFYGVAHWLIGPTFGVKQPEWRSDAGTIGMHLANHAAFGLATAAGAKLGARTTD